MVYPPQGFPTAAAAKPAEATIFVAASDARPEVKALADFVASGTNDDITIENAINALPTTGGRVRLSEGTFILGSSIDILKSNVCLEGSGPGTKIFLANGSNCDVIRVGNGSTALSNVKICNLLIDGNKAGQTSGYIAGIHLYGSSSYIISNCVVENCYISNTRTYGIMGEYCNYCIIKNNFISNSGLYGVCITYSNYNSVEGNICLNNNSYGIGVILDSKYNRVYGNYAEGSGFGLYDSNNTLSNLFVGNVVVNSSKRGIFVNNQDVVVGNIVIGSGIYDIYLESGSVIGNVCLSSASTGIYISSGAAVGNYLSGQVKKIAVGGTDVYLGFNIEV